MNYYEIKWKRWKNYYFVICLLIPKETLLRIVSEYGGLEEVINNRSLLIILANMFKVPLNLIKIRVYSLYMDNEKEKIIV